ncbi:heme ABC exporter ATP-binding protein CcmA [Methylocapsa palsarum]|uniref:Heme exporter protein A n=1 Tax=Methylocapsa palsarum TaxID=1612308 RepID=A0A1I4BHK9_9HYPH|nr:heme ABC exporter ATP-binding protein CcmA [Methylocapsa palsarum]SFK68264.1 heme exporter protein A [Methylocapsa palsarum]
MRLEASELAVERGGRIVFSNVSFAIQSGESLIVTGRNGAGKSTLLRALAGFLPLRGGEVSLTPLLEDSIAENIHYIGHADALKGALTVAENLSFFGALLRSGQGGLSVEDALAEVGLVPLADLPAAYLSAGQKRRASLAKLRIALRPVWLLDEPSNALDAAAQQAMETVMAAHLSAGGMIVAATHARLELAGRELRLGAAT